MCLFSRKKVGTIFSIISQVSSDKINSSTNSGASSNYCTVQANLNSECSHIACM